MCILIDLYKLLKYLYFIILLIFWERNDTILMKVKNGLENVSPTEDDLYLRSNLLVFLPFGVALANREIQSGTVRNLAGDWGQTACQGRYRWLASIVIILWPFRRPENTDFVHVRLQVVVSSQSIFPR